MTTGLRKSLLSSHGKSTKACCILAEIGDDSEVFTEPTTRAQQRPSNVYQFLPECSTPSMLK